MSLATGSPSRRPLAQLLAPAPPAQVALEETGIALSTSVLRLGYFMGGDGQSRLKVDLRNAAGFIRHEGAAVTAFLLPIKVRLTTKSHGPAGMLVAFACSCTPATSHQTHL